MTSLFSNNNNNNNNNNNSHVTEENAPYVEFPGDTEKYSLALPEFSGSIPPTKSNEIFEQNKTLLEYSQYSLSSVYRGMSHNFNKNKLTQDSKPFALCIERNAQELMQTRAQYRLSLQLIWQLLSYKPMEMTPQWTLICNHAKLISNAALNISISCAKYTSFLVRIYDSMQYFCTTQTNGENHMPLTISMMSLQKDIQEFEEFSRQYQSTIKALRTQSENTMNALFLHLPGTKNVKELFQQLSKKQDLLLKAKTELDKAQTDKRQKLMELRMANAKLQGNIEVAKVKVGVYLGQVNNYREEVEKARSKSNKLIIDAVEATNYRQELWVKTRSGTTWTGKRYSYVKDFYRNIRTGNKARLKRSAASYKDIKKYFKSKVKRKNKYLQKAQKELLKLETNYAKNHRKYIDIKKDALKKIAELKDIKDLKQNEYNKNYKKISELSKNFGMHDEQNLCDFFSLAMQLHQTSFNAMENSLVSNENLNEFSEVASKRACSNLTIDQYFSLQGNSNSPDVSLVVLALKNEGISTVSCAQCKTYKEFKRDIFSVVEELPSIGGGTKNIGIGTKRILQKMCLDSKHWKKDEKAMRRSNGNILLGQMPVLSSFFHAMSETVCKVNNALKFESIENAKASYPTICFQLGKLKACAADDGPLPSQLMIEYFPKMDESDEDEESADELPIKRKKSKKRLKQRKKHKKHRYESSESESSESETDSESESESSSSNNDKSDSDSDSDEESGSGSGSDSDNDSKDAESDAESDSGSESVSVLDFKQLLSMWDLSQYCTIFEKDALENVDDWGFLTAEDLDTIFPKRGHRLKFERKLEEFHQQTKKTMTKSKPTKPKPKPKSKSKSKMKLIEIVKREFLFESIDKHDLMTCLDDDYHRIYIELSGEKSLVKKVKSVIRKGERKKNDVGIRVTEKHMQYRKKRGIEILYVVKGAELKSKKSKKLKKKLKKKYKKSRK